MNFLCLSILLTMRWTLTSSTSVVPKSSLSERRPSWVSSSRLDGGHHHHHQRHFPRSSSPFSSSSSSDMNVENSRNNLFKYSPFSSSNSNSVDFRSDFDEYLDEKDDLEQQQQPVPDERFGGRFIRNGLVGETDAGAGSSWSRVLADSEYTTGDSTADDGGQDASVGGEQITTTSSPSVGGNGDQQEEVTPESSSQQPSDAQPAPTNNPSTAAPPFSTINLCLLSNGVRLPEECPSGGPEVQLTTPGRNATGQYFTELDKQMAKDRHLSGAQPINYNIQFNFLDRKNYSGQVLIIFRALLPSRQIQFHLNSTVLNVDWSTINLQKLCRNGRPKICIEKATVEADKELVTLDLANPLDLDRKYVLKVSFSRNTLEETFFGVRYANEMEGSWAFHLFLPFRGARSVFPCLDHPILKATFELCIEYPSDLNVASNMPESYFDKSQDGKRAWSCFERTPRMSTYLFSFALLHKMVKEIRDTGSGNAALSLIYPHATDEDFDWIFNVATQSLDKMRNITGIPFQLPKLDTLIIHPYSHGGMENFGLVTLALKIFSNKEYVKRVVVHEVIHQWIGNLVTLSTWDEICLQEGLTTYLDYILSAELGLNSSTTEVRMRDARSNMLKWEEANDALPQVTVKEFNNTNGVINFQCYTKSALIFQMLDKSFGNGTFIKEFTKQLTNRFSFDNFNFSQILELVREVAASDLAAKMMEAWMTRPAYPVLFVDSSEAAKKQVVVTQKLWQNNEITSSWEFGFPTLLFGYGFRKRIMNRPQVKLRTLPGYESVILDRHKLIYGRILYDGLGYGFLFRFLQQFGAEKTLRDLLIDFCWGLKRDQFPFTIAPGNKEKRGWQQFLHMLTIQDFLPFWNQGGYQCFCCAAKLLNPAFVCGPRFQQAYDCSQTKLFELMNDGSSPNSAQSPPPKDLFDPRSLSAAAASAASMMGASNGGGLRGLMSMSAAAQQGGALRPMLSGSLPLPTNGLNPNSPQSAAASIFSSSSPQAVFNQFNNKH